MEPTWLKARSSKYKHLYSGRVAVCGSKAKPIVKWWERTWYAPKCPRCLIIEEQRQARQAQAQLWR